MAIAIKFLETLKTEKAPMHVLQGLLASAKAACSQDAGDFLCVLIEPLESALQATQYGLRATQPPHVEAVRRQ